LLCFFFSSRRRHTRFSRDWSSDVCSSDLFKIEGGFLRKRVRSFITECDGHTPGDKRHFPEALFQPFIIKIIPFQHGEVRFEGDRSEERRVGKECRSRWAPCEERKKIRGKE